MVARSPKPLTARQEQVLLFIARYFEDHDTAPTITEIAAGMKANTANPKPFTDPLRKKGFIEVVPNIARGIRLTPKAKHWFAQYKAGELPLR